MALETSLLVGSFAVGLPGSRGSSIDLLFDKDALVTDPLGLRDASNRHVVLAYVYAARRQIWEFNKPDISVLDDFDARLSAHIHHDDRGLFRECLVCDPITNLKTADSDRFSRTSRLSLDGATFQVMMGLARQYCPLDYTMMALETFNIYSKLFHLALLLGVDRIFSMLDRAKSNLTSAVRLRQIPYSDFRKVYGNEIQPAHGYEKIPYCFEDVSNPAYLEYMLRFFSRERYEYYFEPENAQFTADLLRAMIGIVKSGVTSLKFASRPEELSERVGYLKRQFGILVAPPKKVVIPSQTEEDYAVRYYFAVQFPKQPFWKGLKTGLKNRLIAFGLGSGQRTMIDLFAQEIKAEIIEQKKQISETLQAGEETRALTSELIERGETVVQDAMTKSQIIRQDLMISETLIEKVINLQRALAEIGEKEFERRRQGRSETPSDLQKSKTPTDFVDLGRTLTGMYTSSEAITSRVKQFLEVELQRYEALVIDAVVTAYLDSKDREGFSRRLFRRTSKETDLYIGQSHSYRVGVLCAELGRICWQRGMTDVDMGIFRSSGEFHDIGKIIIPEKGILAKSKGLSELESEFMRKHPEYGMKILVSLAYEPYLIETAYCHHERWDGSGYPRKLSGKEIPFIARVVAVMDSLDAIIGMDRAYKSPTDVSEAVSIILTDFARRNIFDPELKEPFREMADTDFFSKAYKSFREESRQQGNR